MAHVEDLRKTKAGPGRMPWRARWQDPDGRERCKSFGKKRDAAAFLKSVEEAQAKGTYVAPDKSKILFRDWVAQYRLLAPKRRMTTENRDNGYLERRILPRFGAMPIGDIRLIHVQAWTKSLEGSLAPETISKANQVLARVLQSAVKHNYLAANPALGVELPKIERSEMRFLTDEELWALADAMDHRYRALVLVGGYCGLRIGELAGLRRRDCGKSLKVERQVLSLNGHLYVEPLKTRSSRRTVPMPAPVYVILQEHLKTVPDDPDAPVFPAPMGGLMDRKRFRNRQWLPALKQSGLYPMRIHDLRHTAVSFWIASNVNVKRVAAWAGHASVSFTLDRYGHLYPDDQADIDRIEARLRLAMP